jgi:hypothetical protein
LRRTLRDRDLRAWRWSLLGDRLDPVPLAIVREPTYPRVEVDWATAVS